MINVLVIGSTGFIGSQIMKELYARDNLNLSVLSRQVDRFYKYPDVVSLPGDIADLGSIRGAIKDVDVVINAASYVGSDKILAKTVNQIGARNVAQAWESSGARRLIHISTTAVYGSGPHRLQPANPTVYRPASVASKTRAEGEASIVDVGGLVIRPNLIYGPGDKWFIPGIIQLFTYLGTQIDNGSARVSVIDVAELGQIVSFLATSLAPQAGVFHAANPIPTTLKELARMITSGICSMRINGTTTLDEAIHILKPLGFRPHQVKMVGMDHHYESQELWDLASLDRTAPAISREAIDWYSSVAMM